jgi:S-adenosylmethionine synthetase
MEPAMERSTFLFTSESVSEGHPDKVCDRISDEIVDLVYREAKKTGVDPWSVRVACETLATTNRVVIAGEVRVPPSLVKKDKNGNDAINPSKFKSAARKAIKSIGYEQDGFHWKTAKIDVLLHFQSAHIAQGVDNAADHQGSEGAGDQGIMFGYACNETPELMPAPIYYSHKILELLAAARHKGEGDAARLGPDAKSQVTVRYVDGKPSEVVSIVLSTQHLDESWNSAKVREVVEPYIREALSGLSIADDCNWYINPTGVRHRRPGRRRGPDRPQDHRRHLWRRCAPRWRCLLRQGHHQGRPLGRLRRALSGQEQSPPALAERCTIQLSYAIGVAQPLSIYVNFHDTGKVSEAALEEALPKVMDLTPRGIRTHLDLNRPIYARTAAYGHFGRKAGRDGSFSWEKLDLVKPLKQALKG